MVISVPKKGGGSAGNRCPSFSKEPLHAFQTAVTGLLGQILKDLPFL